MLSYTFAALLIIVAMALLIVLRDIDHWQSFYLNHRMKHFRTLVKRNWQTFTPEQLRHIFVTELGVLEFFLEPHPTAGFSNRELSWLLNAQANLGATASLVLGYARTSNSSSQAPLLWVEFSYRNRLWLLHYEYGCPIFAKSDPKRFCEVNRLNGSAAPPNSPLTCPECASST